MRADVFCNNNPIGTIDWTPDACGVQVNLDCAVCGDELLRCYAVVNGNILRVGLPAPEHGRLRLRASRGKCCMRLAVRANPNSSISRLRRSLCRRAMRRPSRRLSPEIRSWTRFYPTKTCRFSRPRPDCVCNVRSTRKSRSRWRPPLCFAAQKETRQCWNGKKDAADAAASLKNVTLGNTA